MTRGSWGARTVLYAVWVEVLAGAKGRAGAVEGESALLRLKKPSADRC